MLRMYTTTWCGDCTVTKNYLNKYGIAFEEIDIEHDAEAAAYVQSVNDGRRSVPTLVVDGEATSLSGFTRAKFDAFLQRHQLLSEAGAPRTST